MSTYDEIVATSNCKAIGGYLPRDQALRRLLNTVGFRRLVSEPSRPHLNTTRVGGRPMFIMRDLGDGSLDVTEASARIGEFVRRYATTLDAERQQLVSMATMELVTNVRTHAYPDDRVAENLRHLYLLGLVNPANGSVTLTMYDRGVGIAASVRTAITEWQFTMSHFIRAGQVIAAQAGGDRNLVLTAAHGKLTESGLPKHGKGIRALREAAEGLDGCALDVFSSKQHFHWEDDRGPRHANVPWASGTLLCLQISEGEHEDTTNDIY